MTKDSSETAPPPDESRFPDPIEEQSVGTAKPVDTSLEKEVDKLPEASQKESTEYSCLVCFEFIHLAPGAQAQTEEDEERQHDVDIEKGITTKPGVRCSPCQHDICLKCLKQYMDSRIKHKRIPAKCFTYECETILSDEIIAMVPVKDSAPSAYVERYRRLVQLVQGKAMECTRCEGLVQLHGEDRMPRATNNADVTSDDLTCSHCGHQFCQVHGDMHSRQTCDQFLASAEGAELRRQEQAVARTTKLCTNCGAHLQKVDGCNHVVCGYCRVHYCWACATHEYMSSYGSCQKCQWKQDCYAVGLFVLYAVLFVLWTPFAMVVFLISGCFCGFFCGGRCIGTDHSSTVRWGRAMQSTLAVLFAPWLMVLAEEYFEEHFPEYS